MKLFWLRRALAGAVLIAVLAMAMGWLVMTLWNWLLPALFGWPGLTLMQALALLLLCRLLFGGLRPGIGRGSNWREKMRGRWVNMSPVEREKLRAGLHNRCEPQRSRADAQ